MTLLECVPFYYEKTEVYLAVFKLTSFAVVSKLYPPEILWQSPTQQVALRGETWSVMCVFSGK
jgi:hypothetical protein